MNEIDKKFREKLISIAEIVAKNSEGKIVLMKDQKSADCEKYFQTINYLQTNTDSGCPQLIGKTIEYYVLLQMGVRGIISLTQFYLNIVLSNKNFIAAEDYQKINDEIKEFGMSLISRNNEEAQDIWFALFP